MKSKLFLGLLMMVALTACGKKPSFVDAPVGQESPFPRQYPRYGEVPPGAELEDMEDDATDYVAEEALAPKPIAKPVAAPAPVGMPPAISDEELNQFQ